MAQTRFVVVGAGLAGAKTVEALRERGFDGDLTLVGGEVHLPYERPPLSKDYLAGKAERDSVFVHDPDWYRANDVDLRLGSPAVQIDRSTHRVELTDGDSVDYDRLLLATGSRPRVWPGAPDGVYYLRTLEDSERLRARFGAGGGRLIVIGGGWIGLEVAAAARAADWSVTVLESLELPLLRVLGPEVAAVFADLHRAHGVELRLGVHVEEVAADGVRLREGDRLDADVVLVGIGAAPNIELAEHAGLDVSQGVVVDSALRTSDPDIFAAGDIAWTYHPLFERHVRVEHWANALNQPAVAAAGMLGEQASYDRLPYFYTDQYDLGMEYRGYAEPGDYDRVVFRGDVAGREFLAFWLREGRVAAGMNVNLWDDGDAISELIRSRRPVDADRLADPAVPLGEVG